MIVLIIALLMGVGSFEKRTVEIWPINNTAGVYMEDMGPVQFIQSNWDLIIHWNFEGIERRIKIIDEIYNQTVMACNVSMITRILPSCSQGLTLFNVTLENINKEMGLYKNMVSHSRVARGLFNAVGTLSKTLFGTLSADDAEKYDKLLSNVERKTDQVAQILGEQTTVVQSTLTTLNSTLKAISYNEKLLNNSLQQMLNFTLKQKQVIDSLELELAVEEHINLLSLITGQVQGEIKSFVDAILFAKTGVVHPSLITPSGLFDQLKLLTLKEELNFVAALNKSNIHELWSTIKPVMYLRDNKLIVILKVPLVNKEKYNMYHLLPLPTLMKDDNALFLTISVRFIAINRIKKHCQLSEKEIDLCEKVNNNFICKSDCLVSSDEQCIKSLLSETNNNNSNVCETQMIKMYLPMFVPLYRHNSWILITHSMSTTLLITCMEGNTPLSNKLMVDRDSLINIQDRCIISTSNDVIYSEDIAESTIIRKNDFVPSVNLQYAYKNVNFEVFDMPKLKLEQSIDVNKYIESLNRNSRHFSELQSNLNRVFDDKTHENVSLVNLIGLNVVIIMVVMLSIIIFKRFYGSKRISTEGRIRLRNGREIELHIVGSKEDLET